MILKLLTFKKSGFWKQTILVIMVHRPNKIIVRRAHRVLFIPILVAIMLNLTLISSSRFDTFKNYLTSLLTSASSKWMSSISRIFLYPPNGFEISCIFLSYCFISSIKSSFSVCILSSSSVKNLCLLKIQVAWYFICPIVSPSILLISNISSILRCVLSS